MFCKTCLEWGNSPAGSRGAWKTRGITDWNHGTELLKQHADSQWHRDAAATAVMARQRRVGSRYLSSSVQTGSRMGRTAMMEQIVGGNTAAVIDV